MDDSKYLALTKKERRFFKKEQKSKELSRTRRNKRIEKVIFISAPIFLAIFSIIFLLKSYVPAKNQGLPKIEINPKEYDAGTISMAAGLVKKTYEIKNVGEGDLKIKDIVTSCDCTYAILRVDNKESPRFGMPGHGTNPIGWSQKIAPDETGYLEVTFDPAFHGPQGTGPAVRVVYISTNDPQNKKAEVRLIANVVK